MMQLVQELGRTAFHIVNGMPSPSFVTLSTLRRFEGLLLDIQEDRQASALLRSLVPEQDPTPHDVARGLADLVPLRFQLRGDQSFRPFSRGSALAFIAARRHEALVEGLQGLAEPLSLAGAEYMVHYLRGQDGVVVGHL
ncbi:hypothetical protein AA0313_2816 [Acetobacter indonesiensis NRIC 0313]|uniref:Uncharacterized protein n=1 Tax=Acetobacter indonesiensis TaxID=104101 RepID=A0A6N3T3W1_9PROT|nr:hypothetical protein [Acetobacter indonesiensis]GAN63275.1 hypothetical protein Abin_024_060 [Acetobacter indonesiensis]GBQ61784.1 hypothetical protein AA0313_2816 [Acetobacter indonesiensis NRIC 0313]GEN03896.1 hypothetical protein AIN02nite_19210 [Acetobacter indonesiensis]